MGETESANPRAGNSAMLVVCDAAGKVQAVTSRSGRDIRPAKAGEDGFAQLFGFNSAVNEWFLERINEARESADYSAEANLDLDGGDTHVFVRVDTLRCDNEHYRLALQFCPSEAPLEVQKLGDGDSIVTRKEWHEIKNHIGALRLYATFLKRRMPEGDDRQIVEKVLQGVNVLIGYLDRVRRGEPQ